MKPTRDRKYLAFIRSLPCVVCGTNRRVEAAHTGVRGLSQKADDRTAIPLCFKHHDRQQPYSYHKLGPAKFQQVFGIDIPLIVERLSARPRIFVDSGYFVGRVDGQEYTLAPIQSGLPFSVRKLIHLRMEMLRGLETWRVA